MASGESSRPPDALDPDIPLLDASTSTSAIPPAAAEEAEVTREHTRIQTRSLRESETSPQAASSSSSSSTSSADPGAASTADAASEQIASEQIIESESPAHSMSSSAGSSGASDIALLEAFRYEISFAFPESQAHAASGLLASPVVVRIRRFREDASESFPLGVSSPELSSGSGGQSAEEFDGSSPILTTTTTTSSSVPHNSSPVEEAASEVPLLIQLCLLPEFDLATTRPPALSPSPLQGTVVRSPEVYYDYVIPSPAPSSSSTAAPAMRIHLQSSNPRLFAVFSDLKVLAPSAPARYSLGALLLRGVQLPHVPPAGHLGSLAAAAAPPVLVPPGRELASCFIPLHVDAAESPARADESAVSSSVGSESTVDHREYDPRLTENERAILNHFRNQGADV
ncbi:hypothetical protein BZA70DRAFT_267321 [Myxozyma melibiosi]|uniref:Uncharacterized protein n=1 Tax=Myxozyma melibiosi TaxID=54550 RepID=A0ABR1F6P1_9ASCO